MARHARASEGRLTVRWEEVPYDQAPPEQRAAWDWFWRRVLFGSVDSDRAGRDRASGDGEASARLGPARAARAPHP